MVAASLSRKILIAVVILLVVHILTQGVMAGALVLDPYKVIPGMQFWRLLTYTLVPGWFGLLFSLIAFSVPGEELEQMLGTRRFGLLLLGVMLLLALLHMVVFYGGHESLSGIANLPVFAFVGFVYLFPHSELRLLFFNIRSWVLLALMGGLILVMGIYAAFSEANFWTFFAGGGLGLLLGAVYFHLRFQKYPFLLRPIRTVERMAGFGRYPSRGQGVAPAQRRTMAHQQVRVRIPFQKPGVRELSDEERLNLILDKINEKSYGSLTEEEQKFLNDYSGRL